MRLGAFCFRKKQLSFYFYPTLPTLNCKNDWSFHALSLYEKVLPKGWQTFATMWQNFWQNYDAHKVFICSQMYNLNTV